MFCGNANYRIGDYGYGDNNRADYYGDSDIVGCEFFHPDSILRCVAGGVKTSALLYKWGMLKFMDGREYWI